MAIEAARAALARTLESPPNEETFKAARHLLTGLGAEALKLSRSPATSLADIFAAAVDAPATPERRAFAVLIVHALAIDGLVVTRGGAERTLHRFLESALLNPLRRAGYPFDGPLYDKRQALRRLHATIDEHLRPFEASIPHWIHGLGRANSSG